MVDTGSFPGGDWYIMLCFVYYAIPQFPKTLHIRSQIPRILQSDCTFISLRLTYEVSIWCYSPAECTAVVIQAF